MSDISSADNVVSPLAIPMASVEWAAVRARRDQLLRNTDFTQLLDYPVTDVHRAEVATYRKALRDIPDQGSDPDAVVWPPKPDFLK